MSIWKKFVAKSFINTYSSISCKNKEMKSVYHYDRNQFKGKPIVILADHSSFDNFANLFYDFDLSNEIIPVIANGETRHPLFGRLVTLFDHIPKRTNVSDLTASIQMMRAARNGKSLLIFPEGMYSYCGTTHPVHPAIAGFLKAIDLDVVLVCSKGAFLATPRYSKDKKNGVVIMDFYHLFTKESLKEKSEEEIYDELMSQFVYNDFQWNAEHHYHYKGKIPNNDGLEKVIYHCPCCHEDGYMKTKKDCIICENCGNMIRMDDTYAIKPASDNDVLPYSRVDEWFLDQRRILRNNIRNDESFSITVNAELNMLNEINRKSMYLSLGKGKITINREGVSYEGEREGEKVHFMTPIENIWSAANSEDRYMSINYGKENLAFDFLSEQSSLVAKACMAVEEFHALVDPMWDKALCRVFNY